MSVTIVNDSGSGIGTRILDEEGVDICALLAVESIDTKISVDSVNRATIILGVVKIETRVNAVEWITKNPLTNTFDKILSINFANGDAIAFDQESGNAKFYRNSEVVRFVPLSDGRTRKWKAVPLENTGSD